MYRITNSNKKATNFLDSNSSKLISDTSNSNSNSKQALERTARNRVFLNSISFLLGSLNGYLTGQLDKLAIFCMFAFCFIQLIEILIIKKGGLNE